MYAAPFATVTPAPPAVTVALATLAATLAPSLLPLIFLLETTPIMPLHLSMVTHNQHHLLLQRPQSLIPKMTTSLVSQPSSSASATLLHIMPIFHLVPRQSLSLRTLLPFLQESLLGWLNNNIITANERRDLLHRVLGESPPPHRSLFFPPLPPTLCTTSPPRGQRVYQTESPLSSDTSSIITPCYPLYNHDSVLSRSAIHASGTVPASLVAGLVSNIAITSPPPRELPDPFSQSLKSLPHIVLFNHACIRAPLSTFSDLLPSFHTLMLSLPRLVTSLGLRMLKQPGYWGTYYGV